MADAWLPGAGRIPADHDGGALKGGAPRVIWFTSEHDPRAVSARSVAADLCREGHPPHLVWNPFSGDIVQLIPATRAGRMLPEPVGAEGRVCLQIVVVAAMRDPFTNGPVKGLDALMCWLDDWDVARRWPAGPPLPAPHSYHSGRHRKSWARGGHFGASQVPEADHPDPGALDIRRITGKETPVAEIPRPRTPAGQESAGAAATTLRPRRIAKPTEPLLAPGRA